MAQPLHEQIPALEQRLSNQPQSPFFARLAQHYLEAGRAQEALRLCDEGLAQYPFYSTGHLIKGKVLLELKMLAEAKREFEVVLGLLPGNECAAQLYSSIDLGPSVDLTAPPAPEPTPAEGFAPPAPEEVAAEEAPPEEAVAEEPSITAAEEIEAEAPAMEAEAPVDQFQEQIQPESMDFGFGAPAGTPPATEATLDAFGEPIVQQPEPYAEPTTEPVEEAPPAEITPAEPTEEAAVAEPIAPVEEAPPAETPPAEGEETPSWLEAFSQLQQPTEETAEPTPEAEVQQENPFAAFGAEAEAPGTEGPIEGELYEEFAARTRMELFGTENTLSLDEYLASSPEEQPASTSDNIEDLAEKLKAPKKITPVIDFTEKTTRPASETDTPAETGFVTPTLAEIYVKQGWYDDAIKAYRALAKSKPAEREKYEQRIAEIEEMKKKEQ
ncbi:MAG: tetratricopeptide repeat protein [Ignavibacteria bacterium]|nr:tetratricopeptide repeat protein [Ignavibacteria bacterium]